MFGKNPNLKKKEIFGQKSKILVKIELFRKKNEIF